MNWKKISSLLLSLLLFFLPWQTRYIWQSGELNKGYWEYGTFSIYGTEILLWIILIIFFVNHFLRKDFLANFKEKSNILRSVFMLFLLTFGLAMVFSKNFWVSYYFVFKFLEAMALLSVLLWEEEKTKYKIALWLGGVGQGILAIIQFLTQYVWGNKWLGMAQQKGENLGTSVIEFADQRWLRAYGSFGSPNSLGIYLAVLFVLGLVLYIKMESVRTRMIISVGQLFILSGLVLSFSRGAWVATTAGAVSLLVILIYHCKLSFPPQAGIQTIRPDTRFPLAAGMTALKDFTKQIFFALAVVIFWLVIFYPVFTARFNFNNRLEAKSITERKSQYIEALSFIQSNPVLGVGPGAYTYALYKKYPTLESWQFQPVHNIYLLALAEVGLAGSIALFFIFKKLFLLVLKNNYIYVPVLVVLAVAGLFDHWLWSMYTGVLLWWIVFGLISKEKLN